MINNNVKKGDSVLIISGKNKGKKGEIIKVDRDNGRVFVEGDKTIKKVLKHVKPKKAQEKGGRIEQPASIDGSNVMIVCASCGKPTRVGYEITSENGKKKKTRICKKCGASLEVKAKAAKAAAKKAARKKRTDIKPEAVSVETNNEKVSE